MVEVVRTEPNWIDIDPEEFTKRLYSNRIIEEECISFRSSMNEPIQSAKVFHFSDDYDLAIVEEIDPVALHKRLTYRLLIPV